MKSKQHRHLYYSTELPNVADHGAVNFMVCEFICGAATIWGQGHNLVIWDLA